MNAQGANGWDMKLSLKYLRKRNQEDEEALEAINTIERVLDFVESGALYQEAYASRSSSRPRREKKSESKQASTKAGSKGLYNSLSFAHIPEYI